MFECNPSWLRSRPLFRPVFSYIIRCLSIRRTTSRLTSEPAGSSRNRNYIRFTAGADLDCISLLHTYPAPRPSVMLTQTTQAKTGKNHAPSPPIYLGLLLFMYITTGSFTRFSANPVE